MEQTLGKRIMQLRKSKGLTQDQLAEQLGVTAQAVSKWENNQSCPDITLLPKLAEIFGVSTDALLGREETPEAETPVHTAEVVEEGKPENNFTFQWDGGRRSGFCFALMVLLVGGLLLAAQILGWDVSFWEILWPCAIVAFGFNSLLGKFSFFSTGCVVFGTYFILRNLDVLPFVLGKEYVLPVLIILAGLALLVDAFKKPRKSGFRMVHNPEKGKAKRQYEVHDGEFEFSASFGEGTQGVVLDTLSSGEISCSFGSYQIDLRDVKAVAEDCELEVNCSFGEVTVLVPARFRVIPDSSAAFGDVSVEGRPHEASQGIIRLDASASFGQIVVKYV